ncbi:hypothetical protein PCE1_000580 [Barthelona sp. PCE]
MNVLDFNSHQRHFSIDGNNYSISVKDSSISHENISIIVPNHRELKCGKFTDTFLLGSRRYFVDAFGECIGIDQENGDVWYEVSGIDIIHILHVNGKLYIYTNGSFFEFSIFDATDVLFALPSNAKCFPFQESLFKLPYFRSFRSIMICNLHDIDDVIHLFHVGDSQHEKILHAVNMTDENIISYTTIDGENSCETFCNNVPLSIISKQTLNAGHITSNANYIACCGLNENAYINDELVHEADYMNGSYSFSYKMSLYGDYLWICGSNFIKFFFLGDEWEHNRYFGYDTFPLVHINCFRLTQGVIMVGYPSTECFFCNVSEDEMNLFRINVHNRSFKLKARFIDDGCFIIGDKLFRFIDGKVVKLLSDLQWNVAESSNCWFTAGRPREILRIHNHLTQYEMVVDSMYFDEDFCKYEITQKRINMLDVIQNVNFDVHGGFSHIKLPTQMGSY